MCSMLLCLALLCSAQQEISLYAKAIPNSIELPDTEKLVSDADGGKIISKVSIPTLTVFLPKKEDATGTAVIICPGGAYHALVATREGSKVAEAFNEKGIAAFVLKYRLPDDLFMKDKSIGPLQDAQRAIQMIRQRANEWNINPDKIGIMGFSAGGHLAATAGTHFEKTFIKNSKGTSLRPDFMILIYPVISFSDSLGHLGSRANLLGKNPTKEQILFFSNENHVSKTTPPTFITHAGDDIVVPVENSLSFYNALKKYSIPSELHIYSSGGHGYLKQPPFNEWFERCYYWMKNNGLIL
jgi:acetyl esterase/lipase